MTVRLILPVALALLGACDRAPSPPEPAQSPAQEVETLPPDETAIVQTSDGAAAVVTASTKIPEPLHGRWGMVPADCDPARADNKGLMTVTADTLRFYESRATIAKVSSADPDRFSGTFSFNGEGQQWSAEVTLARSGDVLSRTEGGSRFTYKRCA